MQAVTAFKPPRHVLVAGATGYIGKQLVPVLVRHGFKVTCLIRNQRLEPTLSKMGCHVMMADLKTANGINAVPKDIDVAFFLVHAMDDASKNLVQVESTIAHNFVQMVQKTSIQQIIFLSGLSNHASPSIHLKSRMAVESILGQTGIPTTVLRSSIIIGSGSASFEIIRDLVVKLLIMVPPKWIKNKCQPICIYSVIDLLIGVIHHPKCTNQVFDIGGPDILSFKSMLHKVAKFRGLTRWIVCVPLLSLRLSALWLYFVTSINFSLSKHLVYSMEQDSVCSNNHITQIIPIKPIDFDTCLRHAFSTLGRPTASGISPEWPLSGMVQRQLNHGLPLQDCLLDQHILDIIDVNAVKNKYWAIGGSNGWYVFNWAWKLRGLIDQWVGGVGLNRGRQHQTKIFAGDTLDFWRVIYANKSEGRLLLYAEMKLPGNAWLEWQIKENNGRPQLIQTAIFRPNGLLGRAYWFALYPLHILIFKKLAGTLAKAGNLNLIS